MTNLTIDNLVAINKQQGVDLDFIGSLIWHTISDCKITRDQVQDLFYQTGIDSKYLPKHINHRDAFRRATKIAEINRVPIEKGKYLNLLVREVKMDKEEMIRTITREVVDANNERLEYTEIIKLRLTGSNLSSEYMASVSDIEMEQAEKVLDVYQENRKHYEGTNMRLLVKNMLSDCSPVSVRPSGGVNFVPVKHEEFAQAIKNFINGLDQYNITKTGKSQAWTVPVVNAQEQREMVEQSLEIQVKSESESLIKEMTSLIKSGNPFREKTVQGYVDRIKSLKKIVAEYEEMLEFQATSAKSALELALRQAVTLLEKVE